jgi:hypothetical protein
MRVETQVVAAIGTVQDPLNCVSPQLAVLSIVHRSWRLTSGLVLGDSCLLCSGL